MALEIALDLHDTGQAYCYWAITSVHLDHAAGQATLWLHGWASAQARANGRAAGAAVQAVLHAPDLASLHDATTARLYTALKACAARHAADPAQALPACGHGPALFAAALDC